MADVGYEHSRSSGRSAFGVSTLYVYGSFSSPTHTLTEQHLSPPQHPSIDPHSVSSGLLPQGLMGYEYSLGLLFSQPFTRLLFHLSGGPTNRFLPVKSAAVTQLCVPRGTDIIAGYTTGVATERRVRPLLIALLTG
ncbi:hypothetical protein EYF80_007156 [Liparis tanakae]|uniref:Uncharacterized protein n=1 Tax=Liparis tanakae TaxID=230148 RepID=A0A4Z2IYR1_9TELE|nr:hypothetical protein EYF80_007156 [Liparis tanakae]